jgi:cell division septation protein DedD
MGSTPDMTAESAPSTRCRSLGPFDDVNAANAAADRLRTRGMNPHDRSAETVNPNVYWVYIGELTVELQRRAIQTLNSAGIHDAVAMTQPEQSDRVSVGVFADQAHAVRRAEQVRALGLKPTLGMRQHTVAAHWIDFELKPAEMEPSLTDLTGPVVRSGIGLGPVKFSDCPAGGGNG